MIKRFITDENGTSAIEYAIIGAVVSVVFIAALASLASGLSSTFDYVSTSTGSTLP
ncbi:MAG: Flp family type IVb pilin [Myxococcota bacterium]